MINKNCETRVNLWVPRTVSRPLISAIAYLSRATSPTEPLRDGRLPT
jgi:hypothetical protein